MKIISTILLFSAVISCQVLANDIITLRSSWSGRIELDMTDCTAKMNGTKFKISSNAPKGGAVLDLNLSPYRDTPSHLNYEFNLQMYPEGRMNGAWYTVVYELAHGRPVGDGKQFTGSGPAKNPMSCR
jgi:hypothetical protein